MTSSVTSPPDRQRMIQPSESSTRGIISTARCYIKNSPHSQHIWPKPQSKFQTQPSFTSPTSSNLKPQFSNIVYSFSEPISAQKKHNTPKSRHQITLKSDSEYMNSVVETERDKYNMINFEETELRLGLPLSGNEAKNTSTAFTGNGKRGFSDTTNTHTVDLKLNLSSTSNTADVAKDNNITAPPPSPPPPARANDPAKPPAKAQVVGWPPVRSFRKNIVNNVQKSNNNDGEKAGTSSSNNVNAGAAFVKVSMDGAPYLRKVDLKLYKSYQELSDALAKMFSSFTFDKCGSQGVKDFMNESKLIDLLNSSDYVPTYEDKDGDWMLVGDVPWEMFVESCKRLRIMKGSEAIGLAPRAVEKCKNRS